jgi:hypothetical protein
MIWTALVCTLGAAYALAPRIADVRASTVTTTSPIGLNSCNVSAVSQPFARWGDYAKYELAPGGDFENSTWKLSGGATRVAGSEPYAVTGALGSYSLSLPAGAAAQSPPSCVDATYPSIRFFIAGTGSVRVDVVAGSSVVPAGVAVAGGGWAPTPVMVTDWGVLAASSGGTSQVSLAFAGLSGAPRIDDVFVDPWSRG